MVPQTRGSTRSPGAWPSPTSTAAGRKGVRAKGDHGPFRHCPLEAAGLQEKSRSDVRGPVPLCRRRPGRRNVNTGSLINASASTAATVGTSSAAAVRTSIGLNAVTISSPSKTDRQALIERRDLAARMSRNLAWAFQRPLRPELDQTAAFGVGHEAELRGPRRACPHVARQLEERQQSGATGFRAGRSDSAQLSKYRARKPAGVAP